MSFPSFEKLAFAYGIPYVKIQNIHEADVQIEYVLNGKGPIIAEVIVNQGQNFEPKLSSKVLEDGRMASPAMDDMYPFLAEEEYLAVHEKCNTI